MLKKKIGGVFSADISEIEDEDSVNHQLEPIINMVFYEICLNGIVQFLHLYDNPAFSLVSQSF